MFVDYFLHFILNIHIDFWYKNYCWLMGSHNFLCKMAGMLDLNSFSKLQGLEAVILGRLCCNAIFLIAFFHWMKQQA